MKTGSKGINLIKTFESLQTEAYLCPAGVWTIGYGHTTGVHEGDTCTESEAEAMLRSDLDKAEQAVNGLKVDLTQCQFDALVSLCFNIGTTAFKRSTLAKKVMADASDPSIGSEFVRWKYAGGRVLNGLLRRRVAEVDLYFS